jgi:hypothetical protein
VVRGVGNLKGFNLSSSLNYSRQKFQHLWIRGAVIGCGIVLVIPQRDSNRFRSVRDDECDFVPEPFLFSEQRNDLVLDRARKLSGAIGLEDHGNVPGKHVSLLHGNLVERRVIPDPLGFQEVVTIRDKLLIG